MSAPYNMLKDSFDRSSSWMKKRLQDEGHSAKDEVIGETATLSAQILGSYQFYIEKPEQPSDYQREAFKQLMEEYGRRAAIIETFADQSEAPDPPSHRQLIIKRADEAYQEGIENAEHAQELFDSLEDGSLDELDISPSLKERIQSIDINDISEEVIENIDDDLYLRQYSTAQSIAKETAEYLANNTTAEELMDELRLGLEVSLLDMEGLKE